MAKSKIEGDSATKKKKRAQGEGSIFQMKNGLWCSKLSVGYDENGKRKRKAYYGKTQKEVREKLTAARAELDKGTYIEPSKMTVEQWLDTWLDTYKKRSVKPTSYRIIHQAIKLHIKPHIGNIKLKDLRADMIQKMVNSISDNGYAPETVKKAHSALNSALNQAVANELILKNPAMQVTLPAIERKKMRILSVEEQEIFITEAKQSFYGKAFILALFTGLRLGELLALTWADVNFKEATLRVNKTQIEYRDYDEIDGHLHREVGTPKTKSSNRTIPLLPNMVKMLKAIKKEQTEERLKLGTAYQDNNLIFPRYDGVLMPFNSVRNEFKAIVKSTGLEGLTPHCLRHTFATRGLEYGIDMKVMQEILGHSSIVMTSDLYTHVTPDNKKDSMMKLSETFSL